MHSVFACRPLVQRRCQRLYRNAAGIQDVDLFVCPLHCRKAPSAGGTCFCFCSALHLTRFSTPRPPFAVPCLSRRPCVRACVRVFMCVRVVPPVFLVCCLSVWVWQCGDQTIAMRGLAGPAKEGTRGRGVGDEPPRHPGLRASRSEDQQWLEKGPQSSPDTNMLGNDFSRDTSLELMHRLGAGAAGA